MSSNIFFRFGTNEGYASFFNKATFYRLYWTSFAGLSHTLLDEGSSMYDGPSVNGTPCNLQYGSLEIKGTQITRQNKGPRTLFLYTYFVCRGSSLDKEKSSHYYC